MRSVVVLALLASEFCFLNAVNNDPCVIPFTYKGRQYTSCTVADDVKPWCSTTSLFDVHGKWRYCQDYVRGEIGGNTGGEPCKFPFSYAGRKYLTCIQTNSVLPWCATINDYYTEHKWSYCKAIKVSNLTNFNAWKLKQPKPSCVSPFKYRGNDVTGCSFAFSRRPWCAITNDYDIHKLWIYCEGVTLVTDGGNDPNKNCSFPYQFGGNMWTTCSPYYSDQPWCGTTNNYDASRNWTYCQAQSYLTTAPPTTTITTTTTVAPTTTIATTVEITTTVPPAGKCKSGESIKWLLLKVGARNEGFREHMLTNLRLRTTLNGNGLEECKAQCLDDPDNKCLSFDGIQFSETQWDCFFFSDLREGTERVSTNPNRDSLEWRCE